MPRKRQQLGAVRLPPPPVSMDLVLGDVDLLTEILLRLPAKSLIRFKSVCKEWVTLISSDHFCHHHTLRRPKLQPSLILQINHLRFFYWNPTSNDENTIIPYSLNVPKHQIVQECNGLLLLEFEPDRSSYNVPNPTLKVLKRNPKTSYYVYNPTTRQSRKISLNNSDKYPCVAAVNLAFDPSKSPYYKVVCVRCTEDSYPCPYSYYDGGLTHQIEVYDSESHTWKLTLETFIGIPISNGVHSNNAIYWWMSYDGGVFFCYDITRNETKTLRSPKDVYPEGHDSFPHFQELDGHLYHFDILETETGRVSVALWELKGDDDDDDDDNDDDDEDDDDDDDDHSQWLFKYLNAMNNEDTNPLRLMGGSEGYRLLTLKAGKIRAYNFLDKSYEDLVDLTSYPYRIPYYSMYDESMKGFLFGETLALV